MISLGLFAEATAIVGRTGSGKTYAAKGIVEQVVDAGRRVIIIDPTGAWWGLRAAADGSDGLPVMIIGGDHGDVALRPDMGADIAEEFGTRHVQAILDISEMTGGEQTRFLTNFLETIYAKNKGALHLVVDEADFVCPQNPMPESRRMSGAFDKIVRRGRIKGFRPLMISQRPAVLHKNVLSQIATMVALKLTSPQDRKAIEEWVKGNADTDQAREVIASLASLDQGEGWIWSPGADVLERTMFPEIRTFDSSRSPEDGETIWAPALAAVDIDEIRDRLEAVDEVQPTAPCSKPDPRCEQEAFERGRKAGFAEGLAAGRGEAVARIRQSLVPVFLELGTDEAPATEAGEADRIPAPPTEQARQSACADQELSPSAQKILGAIAAAAPRTVTFDTAAKRAGISRRSSQYRSYRRQIEASGLVHSNERGFCAIPGVTPNALPAPTSLDGWISRLDGPSGKLLRALSVSRSALDRAELAAQSGISPTSSGLGAGIRDLRDLGLIEQSGDRYRVHSDFLGPANGGGAS